MQCEQKYDIFISYRRATGANAARMMQLALTARGYSVFLDYDSLEDGKFNEAIYSAIDSCEVFILMMTEGALDRCMNPGDWVRLEIQRAIEQKKNIVPVAPSDQTWSFPDGLPRELSVLRNVHVSKLDMEELFNESIVKIETARFPKTVRARRRNVDRTDNGVKHAVGMREGGSAPLLLDDMRKRVMQRLADLQQLHDSIDEFRNCRERASDWDSHIAHADDLWRKVCGIRTPTSIGEADKSIARIGRAGAGVEKEAEWLRCRRIQKKREKMVGWRLLQWWEESDLRGWLRLAFGIGGLVSLVFCVASLLDEESFYVSVGGALGVVSYCVLIWWTGKWYHKLSETAFLMLSTVVVGFCVYWWIPKHRVEVVDGVSWEYDECMWFSLVGDVGMWGCDTARYLGFTIGGSAGRLHGHAVKKSTIGDLVVPSSLGGRPVIEIMDDAFQGCTNLSSVTIPRTVKKIGKCAFAECRNLRSVKIPPSMKRIEWWAFKGCERLTSVSIPESVVHIGHGTFGECYNLSRIEVAERNANYLVSEGVLCDRNGCVVSCPGALTSVEPGFYAKKIGDRAFWGCTNLTMIAIPPRVTEIGYAAFSGCKNMREVVIPPDVTSIGIEAFYVCESLTSVTIPQRVERIGRLAFGWCRSLQSVIVQSGLSEIDDMTFFCCDNLRSVTIPPSVTKIGKDAFSCCDKLVTVYVGVGDVSRVEGMMAKAGAHVERINFVEQ